MADGALPDVPTGTTFPAGSRWRWPAPATASGEDLTQHGRVVTLMVMSETMPLAVVKAHLSEVVDRVVRTHDRVTITRHGRREAVIIAPEDLDALEETLEILSDPEALLDVAEGRRAAARNEGMDAVALRQRYLRGR